MCTCVILHIIFVLGKTWKHVWGHLSDDYSRRVIKNFLCKQEIARANRLNRANRNRPNELNHGGLAALHRAGSGPFGPHAEFGNMVKSLYDNGKLIII